MGITWGRQRLLHNTGCWLKAQSSGQTARSWITFPWLCWGDGDGVMQSREERLWEQRKNILIMVLQNSFTFCYYGRSDEMQHKKLQTAKRIRECVPKHTTKRSQRFSIICYYQTQQRWSCSDAPTRGEKSITETLNTACRAKYAISMCVGGTRLISPNCVRHWRITTKTSFCMPHWRAPGSQDIWTNKLLWWLCNHKCFLCLTYRVCALLFLPVTMNWCICITGRTHAENNTTFFFHKHFCTITENG